MDIENLSEDLTARYFRDGKDSFKKDLYEIPKILPENAFYSEPNLNAYDDSDVPF
jgi:hypothetical protein